MKRLKGTLAFGLSYLMLAAPAGFAANHREAPITALDHTADITDWYAFVSYDDPDKVTFILNVDPLLEPSNGPNYFPFDPDVVYRIHIDNNHDAVEDVTFEFRFQTEYRAPGVFTAYVGAGAGINAPANAPGGSSGTPVVPPAITALDGDGAAGLAVRQTYTVTMIKGDDESGTRTQLGADKKLFAVPTNVGPRTMPDYPSLARQGVYELEKRIRVFAGTVDDPFYIDLGATFDSLNFRPEAFATGVTGVLTPLQDLNDFQNFAPDAVSGFNVNSIAIEVPISLVTAQGKKLTAGEPDATIGTWGATYRAQTTVRRSPDPTTTEGPLRQVQRMGNPLINELIIGTGSKDKFSMSEPKDDAQFASFALDPVLARVFNAVFGISVPDPPRVDLLPLVQYVPPIAAPDTPKGPVADLLRLNTGVPPSAAPTRSRLGVLGGDNAGFPNGRRVSDDVTDIASRVVAGVLAGPPFSTAANAWLGDGVNTNDVAYQETFPYVAWAHSGRERRHVDAGEKACTPNCP
jgi:hypothetical protein